MSPEDPRGQYGFLCFFGLRGFLCIDPGRHARGRRRRDCAGLKELATIGAIRFVLAHLGRLLITKVGTPVSLGAVSS